ncbi:MAG: signal recognition particle protein [Deltaproteobacteria bacterium]|nr:signal recognition particle protein [Deltaproteobacteria bacterium]
MFDVLIQGFRNAKERFQGIREINEENISDVLRDIRVALLEADVEYNVVKKFLDRVKEKSLGEKVLTQVAHDGVKYKVTPGEHFVKLCHDELVDLMGGDSTGITLDPKGVTSVMMVGLHGSGKTTTAAKIANLLVKQNRKPMLVAADIYRPAAISQLKVLGERLSLPVFHMENTRPPILCREALKKASETGSDVVIYDTAGRLAIDNELMLELEAVKSETSPKNILLVVDAMIGQDAVRTASEFNRRLGITGVVLTKMDGDARGGAALSVREVTGRPIVYVGTGETLDKLEEFRAEGVASRVLGFGDVVGLVKDFEAVVDEKQAEEDALKMLKGEFTLLHFLDQIKAIKKMGSVRDLMEKLPMFSEMMPKEAMVDDNAILRIEAIIQSMTPKERMKPDSIDESRAKRIAKGSGRAVNEVFDLIKKFQVMQQVMKRVGQSPGLLSKIPGFREMLQFQKMKGMDVSEFMGSDFAEERKKSVMKVFDKERRRRREKLAKLARKKQRRKR